MLAVDKRFDSEDVIIDTLKKIISLKIQSGSMRLRKTHNIALAKQSLKKLMLQRGQNED